MNLSVQAKRAWERIPQHVRVRLLNNVFCVTCGGNTGIGEVSGAVKQGDLILEGVCTKCGSPVARVIENAGR